MLCPNCGTRTETEHQYCMHCGTSLHSKLPTPEQALTGQNLQDPAQYVPVPTGESERAEVVSMQSIKPSRDSTYGLQPQTPVYGASGNAALHIWGPFAGFGSRRRHIGWLMDKKGEYAESLVTQVKEGFNHRRIPGALVRQETLTAQGLLVEQRTYFILRRGLASMALYIASFGKDLYISLASYLKPPISNLRILVLLVMVIFWFYMTFGFPIALNNAIYALFANFGSGMFGGVPASGGNNLAGLVCVVGPLGFINTLALLLFFAYSIYKYITEKDILAGLRSRPNEFNEDDLMAMEKAVEQTVRIALTEVKLNPDDLQEIDAIRSGQLF